MRIPSGADIPARSETREGSGGSSRSSCLLASLTRSLLSSPSLSRVSLPPCLPPHKNPAPSASLSPSLPPRRGDKTRGFEASTIRLRPAVGNAAPPLSAVSTTFTIREMQSLLATDRGKAAAVMAGTVAVACVGRSLVWLLRARSSENVYESQQMLAEYLHFHYARGSEALAYEVGPRDALDFPARCARLCIEQSLGPEVAIPNRALDVGCAVGRSTFELARRFQSVLGVDLSQSFVRTSEELRDTGSKRYRIKEEGDLSKELVARVPHDIERGRCSFVQGDACALPGDLGTFGCVLAANLLCRLPDPMAFLNRVPGLVAPGGVLVITGPYTWMESFTPKSSWLGGYTDASGNPVRGADTLKRVLSPNFTLLWEGDLPLLLRETARRYQWTVAHATAWRRKG